MVSIRNIVMLAIMQVGVIVAGVLAAGVCARIFASNGTVMPLLVSILYRYGVVGLVIPLAWVTGAVMLQLRASVSDNIKILMFWAGILLVVMLGAFVVYADLPSLIRAMGTFNTGTGGDGGGE